MMKLVVFACLMAAASAVEFIAPYAYGQYLGYPDNYRGPLSLAPGQPANILGSDGRPLDTLDVNLDKSAHFAAKGYPYGGIHFLKKRSAPLLTSYAGLHYPTAALPLHYSAPLHAAPISTPLSYSYSPHLPYSIPGYYL